MGFGNWIEKRQFEYPADHVYETLLGLLQHLGLTIDSWDPKLRGVTARPVPSWTPDIRSQMRVAASVQPDGENASVVTIESGPAYQPAIGRWHKKHVAKIFSDLSRVLEESSE